MNIKKLREAAGLSQMALSEIISVPQSTIASWETGRALPRADKLPLIAKALGCTIDDLLNEKPNKRAKQRRCDCGKKIQENQV